MQNKIAKNDLETINEIIGAIKESSTAYISWHARPDGDALGGGLALYKILSDMGLDVRPVSPTKPSENYNFLKNFHKIEYSKQTEERDICFVIDCSNLDRLEGAGNLPSLSKKLICIDHHQNNQMFGSINYVRPEVSSVAELIMNVAKVAGTEIDKDFALSIYVGLLTDTNRFQEQNTNPQSHLLAAELLEYVSPVDVATKIYGSESYDKLKLTAKALDSLKLSSSGRVGYMVLTPEMMEESGGLDENTEGLVNYARNIRGADAGVLFRKIKGLEGVKVSFRSKGLLDVGSISEIYGGGGHHNASGCTFKGSLDDAVNEIIPLLERKLDELA